jgi:hypothetical protein
MKVNLIPRKNLAILSAAFCTVMFAFSQNASATRHPLPPVTLATSIEGSINFAGSVQFDTNSLLTATRVNTWFDVSHNAGFSNVTGGATGAFALILPGTQALMATPWIFSPSTPTQGLWSVGGFTFDLLSSTVVTRTATFLNVTGTGTISGNGFDDTPGAWSFTAQKPGTTEFSFSASSSSVPDGGVTVALLGLTLVGVEVLRRKLKAA